MSAKARQVGDSALHAWRTSLQVKVIGSIAAASLTVILVLGFVMITVVAQRLMDTKLAFASQEIERSRTVVEQQIAATDTSNSLQVRLNSARAALTTRNQSATDSVAVFEPVLLVRNTDGSISTSPEGYTIPAPLVDFVAQRSVSFQYTTVTRSDNTHFKALIIGTPTDTDISNLELFLVFPLDNEETTMSLTRGLLLAGGLVLIVLLVGIAWLSTKQVTGPLRSASRIAERFAGGHLRERMVVDGEDEMARLAHSFNAMAESLSKQIRQLEEYGDLQRQFTSDVSHELRTPLTTVRMAADMIADRQEDLDPLTARASQLMVRELDRFESLLGDLLEISRHDAGMADLAEERLDIRSVVTAAWQHTHHLADELDVPVHFYLPEEPVYATIDSRRIERILRNLLANAIDHSESRPVEVLLGASDDAIAITVTDHGVGLKPGQEDLVFNRFWRADPSRVRHSGGTGLGLAISHEDAVLHGGTLDAAGTPGVGSVFRLTIPRQPRAPYDRSPLELLAPEPGAAGLASAEHVDAPVVTSPTPSPDVLTTPSGQWPAQPPAAPPVVEPPEVPEGMVYDPDFDRDEEAAARAIAEAHPTTTDGLPGVNQPGTHTPGAPRPETQTPEATSPAHDPAPEDAEPARPRTRPTTDTTDEA